MTRSEPKCTNGDAPTIKRRSHRLIITSFAVTVANFIHFFAQLLIGYEIAGTSILELPNTIFTTLFVLSFTFGVATIFAHLLSGKYDQDIEAKSAASFLISIPFALLVILVFRLPYSSVFLGFGFSFQLIFYYLTIISLKWINKPIIGVPNENISDFAEIFPTQLIKVVSPEMTEPVELDIVVLSEHQLGSAKWSGILMHCFLHAIVVEEHTNLIEKLRGRIDLNRFSFRRSLHLVRQNNYLALKRVIDLSLSFLLLILLFPLMLFVGFLICTETKGGAIFSQQRVGLSGKPFTIRKFRTMRNEEYGKQTKFALKNDDRITRIGQFLRRTRIDELPQLWNVLVGDMSLIGPRPEQVGLIESIETEIPLFSLRHSIRPGVTGWAQVKHGYADNLATTRTKLSYDLWYVSNASLLLDLSILLLTLKVMITGFGSR